MALTRIILEVTALWHKALSYSFHVVTKKSNFAMLGSSTPRIGDWPRKSLLWFCAFFQDMYELWVILAMQVSKLTTYLFILRRRASTRRALLMMRIIVPAKPPCEHDLLMRMTLTMNPREKSSNYPNLPQLTYISSVVAVSGPGSFWFHPGLDISFWILRSFAALQRATSAERLTIHGLNNRDVGILDSQQ